MQVVVDSTECHRHAAVCPRRPPGANGLFPGNAAWVRAVRAMMGLHKLHKDLWKIIPEEDFQSAYTALIPVLVQFRLNMYGPDILRHVRVEDEIVNIAGKVLCLYSVLS
jgi:hypothetical protein